MGKELQDPRRTEPPMDGLGEREMLAAWLEFHRNGRLVSALSIAAAIGRGIGVPAASISASDAGEHFALLGAFAGIDNPVTSEVTRKVLGWEPAHQGLIEDLEQGHYFSQD